MIRKQRATAFHSTGSKAYAVHCRTTRMRRKEASRYVHMEMHLSNDSMLKEASPGELGKYIER